MSASATGSSSNRITPRPAVSVIVSSVRRSAAAVSSSRSRRRRAKCCERRGRSAAVLDGCGRGLNWGVYGGRRAGVVGTWVRYVLAANSSSQMRPRSWSSRSANRICSGVPPFPRFAITR